MKIFDGLSDISAQQQEAVIVIGNFDGVHKGHQALLQQARAKANELGVACGVLTFEPHPRRLFRPDEPPGRITPKHLKADRLKAYDVDFIFALNFNWDLASLSSDDFIQQILLDSLKARHVFIGQDFRFGQMRKGTPACIENAGIGVTPIEAVLGDNGERYSSSEVRQALRHGEIVRANTMLGWDWEIHGEVIKGDQRGRELGYPTANLKLGETVHPAYGIYAAFVQITDEEDWHLSAVNVGIRPMFEVPVAQVEAHILDFDRDIYGKILRVKLIERLRSEAKFDSLDALIAQMDKDCAKARKVLKARL